MLIEFLVSVFVAAFVGIAVLGHLLVAMALVRGEGRSRPTGGGLTKWLRLSPQPEPGASFLKIGGGGNLSVAVFRHQAARACRPGTV